MNLIAAHHTHTYFSDGFGDPRAYLEKAIQYNLAGYGFSDHAPIPNLEVSLMSLDTLRTYGKVIDKLKQEFAGVLPIYKSLEVDYIPGYIGVSSEHIRKADLDYIIGAVHYVDFFPDGKPWGFEGSHENFEQGVKEIFSGDIQAAVSRYYHLIREMVTYDPPDVVAHLDRIKKLNYRHEYFTESDAWYREQVISTLEAIANAGCIMEVNTKGYYRKELNDLYPSVWILEIARELQIPVHLASDAHHPEDIIGGFTYGMGVLRHVGFNDTVMMQEGGWMRVPLKRPKLHVV